MSLPPALCPRASRAPFPAAPRFGALLDLVRDMSAADWGRAVQFYQHHLAVLAHFLEQAQAALLRDYRELAGQLLGRFRPPLTVYQAALVEGARAWVSMAVKHSVPVAVPVGSGGLWPSLPLRAMPWKRGALDWCGDVVAYSSEIVHYGGGRVETCALGVSAHRAVLAPGGRTVAAGRYVFDGHSGARLHTVPENLGCFSPDGSRYAFVEGTRAMVLDVAAGSVNVAHEVAGAECLAVDWPASGLVVLAFTPTHMRVRAGGAAFSLELGPHDELPHVAAVRASPHGESYLAVLGTDDPTRRHQLCRFDSTGIRARFSFVDKDFAGDVRWVPSLDPSAGGWVQVSSGPLYRGRDLVPVAQLDGALVVEDGQGLWLARRATTKSGLGARLRPVALSARGEYVGHLQGLEGAMELHVTQPATRAVSVYPLPPAIWECDPVLFSPNATMVAVGEFVLERASGAVLAELDESPVRWVSETELRLSRSTMRRAADGSWESVAAQPMDEPRPRGGPIDFDRLRDLKLQPGFGDGRVVHNVLQFLCPARLPLQDERHADVGGVGFTLDSGWAGDLTCHLSVKGLLVQAPAVDRAPPALWELKLWE